MPELFPGPCQDQENCRKSEFRNPTDCWDKPKFLFDQKFSEFPCCSLTALQSLDLSNSSFSGSIPASFNSPTSPSLLSYTAFANDITGPLPASLPANLTTFGLGDNKLNGTLPSYTSSALGTFQVNLSLVAFLLRCLVIFLKDRRNLTVSRTPT